MALIREKQFYKQVAKLVLPVAIQSLITTGINLMDTVMLGSFGELQLSATSLSNKFVMLFQIFCMGIGCGAAVLTAQYWGSQEKTELRQVMTLMYRIALVVSLICMCFTIVKKEWILSVYTDDEAVIQYGIQYMEILQYTFVFYGISIVSTQVLRSIKAMRIPMYASCISFFLNIACNYVFIFGKFGMPRMEIKGAALGTLIARAFEMCYIMGYILFVDQKIGYRIRHLGDSCGVQLKKFVCYSFPVIVSDMLLGIGNSAVSVVMGHIGTAFVAADSVTSVVSHISTVFVMGFATAASSMVGNTLGSGDEKRAFDEGITFFCMSILLGIWGCMVILVASEPMLQFYTLASETVEITRQLMQAIAIIVFLWIVSIPLGSMAGLVWHWRPFWIYIALSGHMILKSILCVWRLLSKKWLHRITVS